MSTNDQISKTTYQHSAIVATIPFLELAMPAKRMHVASIPAHGLDIVRRRAIRVGLQPVDKQRTQHIEGVFAHRLLMQQLSRFPLVMQS